MVSIKSSNYPYPTQMATNNKLYALRFADPDNANSNRFNELIGQGIHDPDCQITKYTLSQIASTCAQYKHINISIQAHNVMETNSESVIFLDFEGELDALNNVVYNCMIRDRTIYFDQNDAITRAQDYYQLIKHLTETDQGNFDYNNNKWANGWTPLMILCSVYDGWDYRETMKPIMKDIIKLLLDKGADREAVSDDGVNAVQIAKYNNNDAIADFINNYQPEQIPETKGVYY